MKNGRKATVAEREKIKKVDSSINMDLHLITGVHSIKGGDTQYELRSITDNTVVLVLVRKKSRF